MNSLVIPHISMSKGKRGVGELHKAVTVLISDAQAQSKDKHISDHTKQNSKRPNEPCHFGCSFCTLWVFMTESLALKNET